MRLLFEMDQRDHSHCTHSFIRNSARSIIVRSGKIAMIHSLKYDYYKFPGGGIEIGEDPVDAMIRETTSEPEAGRSSGGSGGPYLGQMEHLISEYRM